MLHFSLGGCRRMAGERAPPFVIIDFQPCVLAKLQTVSSQWSYIENHHVMSHHPDPNEKTRMEGANVPVSRHRHPRPGWKVPRVAIHSLYLNNRPVAGIRQCTSEMTALVGIHRKAEVIIVNWQRNRKMFGGPKLQKHRESQCKVPVHSDMI